MLFSQKFLVYKMRDIIVQNMFEIEQIPSYIQFYRIISSLLEEERAEFEGLKEKLFDFIINTRSENLPLSLRINHNMSKYYWYIEINNQSMKEQTINLIILDIDNRLEDLTEICFISLLIMMIKDRRIFKKYPQFCNKIEKILQQDRRFVFQNLDNRQQDNKDKIKNMIISQFKREFNLIDTDANDINHLNYLNFKSERSTIQDKDLIWLISLWLEFILFSKTQSLSSNLFLKNFIINLVEEYLLIHYRDFSDLELLDEGIFSLIHKLILLESQTEEIMKERDWFSSKDGLILFPIEDREKIPDKILEIINMTIGLFHYGFYDASAVFIRKSIEAAIVIGFKMIKRENDIRQVNGSLIKLEKCFDLVLNSHLITKSQRGNLSQCKVLADEAVHNFRINYFSKEEVERSFQTLRFTLLNFFTEIKTKIESFSNKM